MKNFMAINRKANIIGFGLLPVGSDLTWIEGVSGGGGSTITSVNLTSQINGVANVFALGGPPASVNSTLIIYNGQTLSPTVDYTVAGSNLTLSFVPAPGDYLYAKFW